MAGSTGAGAPSTPDECPEAGVPILDLDAMMDRSFRTLDPWGRSSTEVAGDLLSAMHRAEDIRLHGLDKGFMKQLSLN